ncbi:MAG: tryptophan synthase subunit alpha [Woeseia sp.]|nr:tryptophan synthase subunit alpha [Woeseia sp.]MBT8097007.1 tryptophan synthase subunit alpha [Woeseia sp.]NNE59724.1 tryptophan synthase subunit alpha [Woeseia sp.]NNL54749.1 tryptophan synthase subunit alpha [Woeseia sp.]
MQPHERLSNALTAAKKGGRTALIPFVTAGYPRRENFIDVLEAISDVGDAVEIGVPFSDPMADGMTIQRSSFEAIKNGVSLRWILDELDGAGERIKAPLVLMSYLNPLLAYGYEKLAARAANCGVCAFIVPDLPFEESEELRAALESKGLGLIQLVTPATPAPRLAKLANASKGFLYAVTITGITGGGSELPDNLANYLDGIAAVSPIPVCAGFGIRAASDVDNVGRHATGAIVGSALVEVLEKGEDPATFLRGLRGDR